uniref:Uncharacterized protein n=1 Tax=Lactuca sativa TaxID=4236 RepID=A0A9R1UP57_LACSA|nr:hypothetical protein LSAT_V11C800444330 [Lactuca sativa]
MLASFSRISLCLKGTYKQYEVAKDGSISPCIGAFVTTMSLPCAHKIKYWKGTTFSLDLIHHHRSIDKLSVSLNKKEHVFSVITKLMNQFDTVFEPVIQQPKGRPPKSKKKRGITSTTRGPSIF